MRLVKLKMRPVAGVPGLDNHFFWVNPDRVTLVRESGGSTYVETASISEDGESTYHFVDHTPEEVVALLTEDKTERWGEES